jgi:hypothetical protein
MTTIGVDLAKPGSEFTVYTVDGVSYRVGPRYYLASCDGCGWIGSSEECGTDEADDVFCPMCHQSGADCGKVANSPDIEVSK